uniref:Uncharacterized protein AlNc14C249G9621 n=1 Tax=Albugo laibachii Nc14 TaxID=890382 RepID=F0WTE2_9STRA|nr:conserved hypothetical protein [Albugo laibachii Nc14]|eukprot:CCA24632.1 conserved hypothetical protein [Albugo laibachii Nc14]
MTPFRLTFATFGDQISLSSANSEIEKNAWSKQPKKTKNAGIQKKEVPRSVEEYEQQNRTSRKLNLDSQKAFPTLGTTATTVQHNSMRMAQTKSVATKNVWSALGNEDEEDNDEDK